MLYNVVGLASWTSWTANCNLQLNSDLKVVYHGILVRTLSLVITSQLSSQTHYKGVQFAELIAPRIQTTSAVQSDNMFFIHIELVFVAVNTVIPTSDDDMLHPKAVVQRIQAITFDTP